MWREQRTVGLLRRGADHKTSCSKTCKYTTNPNEPQGKNIEAQTMASDRRKPTITGWLESRAKRSYVRGENNDVM